MFVFVMVVLGGGLIAISELARRAVEAERVHG
jgi:hypothetical protein